MLTPVNSAQRLSASNLRTLSPYRGVSVEFAPAQRLSASNLRTQRSLDLLIHMNSQSILQASVESMQ